MLLGTFVGQGYVSMNEEEMQFCRETINKAFKENFNFDLIDFGFEEIKDAKSYDDERIFEVKVSFNKEITLRDSHGNAYIPKYIRISVSKQKGYDQNEVGVFNTWAEGFKPKLDKQSFSCNINLIGHYRGYRCKNVALYVGIVPSHYAYGTELTDLLLEYSFDTISDYMEHSSYSREQLVLPISHTLKSIG